MYPEQPSKKNTESQILLPEDGEIMEPSKLYKHQGDTSVTSSKMSLMSDPKPNVQKEKAKDVGLHTVESQVQNKKTISKGKKNPLKKATRNTKSSKTSGQESTLKEEDYCEWLTPYWQETSKKLLSLIKTDSAGSPLISSSGYVNEETQISWSRNKSYVPQSKNSQKISWPSFTSSPVNSTGQGGTKNKKPMRSKKVRIKPTPEQAQILRFWMSTHRKTYNEALRLVKDKKAKANMVLKKLVVTRRKTDKGSKFENIKKSPATIRGAAVRALCANFRSAKCAYAERIKRIKTHKIKNKRKRKNNTCCNRNRFKNKKPFEVKYKSRHLTSDSFELEGKSIRMNKKNLTLFETESNYKMDLKVSEKLSDSKVKPGHSCKIGYCFGRWYFIIPEYVESEDQDMEVKEPRIVGIDPGIRKVFTSVSNSGRIDEIGILTKETMKKLKYKKNGIREAIKNTIDSKKRNKLMRAWYRVNARAKDLVTDFHFKTIKFLMDNYDVIILGKLNVQSLMSMKKQSKSNKDMFQFLSHFLFRQRLLMKTSVTHHKVIIQDESYTTQACVQCGFLDKNVGSSEVYNCPKCNFKMGRDISGAANILLKCASEINQKESKLSGRKRKIIN